MNVEIFPKLLLGVLDVAKNYGYDKKIKSRIEKLTFIINPIIVQF